MTTRRRRLAAGAALAALAAAGGALWLAAHPGALPHGPVAGHDGFDAAELGRLRPGDVILRRGAGLPSDLIVAFLDDGLGVSHAALVLDAPGGGAGPSGAVIESLNAGLGAADGVQTQTIDDFNRSSLPRSLVVLRPRYGPGGAAAAAAAARELLAAGAPFDNDYDLADRRRLYCGELLAEIFERSGWWPRPVAGHSPRYRLAGRWLDFRSFADPAWFDVALSHNPALPAP